MSIPRRLFAFFKRGGSRPFQSHEVPPPSDCPIFDCSTVVSQPDSHLVYAMQRERGAVLYDPCFKCWVLTGHPDITEVLLRNDLFGTEYTKGFNRYLFSEVESERRESKRCMRSVLSVDRMVVEGFVDRWMDVFLREKGSFDAVRDYGIPLPIAFTSDMLGLRESELQRILSKLSSFRTDMAPSMVPMEKLLSDLLSEVRADPRPGVFSHLVQTAPESGMTDHQIVIMVRHLWYGSTVTLSTLLPLLMLWLCRRPDLAEELRADPSRIPNFISEVMRLESPVQFLERTCESDFSFLGRGFSRGALVRLCLASANRDPRVFPDPDVFDLGRPAYRNLALGYGDHFCLGAMQAKIIAETSVRRMLSASTSIRFRNPEEKVRYEENKVFRALAGLEVVMDRTVPAN